MVKKAFKSIYLIFNMIKGATLAILLLGVVLVSGCTTGQVTKKDSSSSTPLCRDVQESYQDCKNIQVPYQETEYYDYYLKAQLINTDIDFPFDLRLGQYALGTVKLRNIDDEAGWFTVTFNWQTLNDKWIGRVRHYIEPDETVTFESKYDITIGEDTKFTHSYKSDPIQKSRVVTKYRTEEKCETKYRTVQKCD